MTIAHPRAGEVLAALDGLRRVIPGASTVFVSDGGDDDKRGGLSIATASDEDARAAAEFFGLGLEAVYYNGRRWVGAQGSITFKGVERIVQVHGPHTDVEPAPPADEARLADAVQAAHEAHAGQGVASCG